MEGSIVTSVARPSSRSVAVDRKFMRMVQELKRFRMNAIGISETKWFGQAMYNGTPYTTLDVQSQEKIKQQSAMTELG